MTSSPASLPRCLRAAALGWDLVLKNLEDRVLTPSSARVPDPLLLIGSPSSSTAGRCCFAKPLRFNNNPINVLEIPHHVCRPWAGAGRAPGDPQRPAVTRSAGCCAGPASTSCPALERAEGRDVAGGPRPHAVDHNYKIMRPMIDELFGRHR